MTLLGAVCPSSGAPDLRLQVRRDAGFVFTLSQGYAAAGFGISQSGIIKSYIKYTALPCIAIVALFSVLSGSALFSISFFSPTVFMNLILVMVIFTMIHGVRLLSEVSCERSDEQQAGARSGEGGAPSGEVMDDEEATVTAALVPEWSRIVPGSKISLCRSSGIAVCRSPSVDRNRRRPES